MTSCVSYFHNPFDKKNTHPHPPSSNDKDQWKVEAKQSNIFVFQDIKLIMPTVLILVFTIFIMATVIPYAFSSVIKQLKGLWALEEHREY